MNSTNDIQLPIDINTINSTTESITLKQIEVEAEKLRLDDLAEIMTNFKQLTDAFIQVKDSDYIEKWYESLKSTVEAEAEPVNNVTEKPAVTKRPRTLQDAMKQNAA